ncbi:siderophore-interacting protein [Streptosporangium sp. NPDC020072]|uniref:siderophore-interacting protein n=1 Tax=Streptosporangium sp. NPDC020072 TaxID=3154788 RepID=UPI0034382BFA
MPTRNPRAAVTFPIVLRELTVLRVSDVTPGMRRVTFGGEQLRAFTRDGLDLPELRSEGFDDHVKFFFGVGDEPPVLPAQNVSSLDWPVDERPLAKDYTPRRFDPEAGEIDFDFVRHEGGVASSWADQAAPGQVAWIAGPKMSHSHPEGADWLLVIGDETALPAIGRWLEEMPEGTRAKVLIEIGDPSHRQELPTRADADVVWLSRDGAPAGTTDLLARAVRELDWLPGTVFVWAAGEAGALKEVRRHLVTEREVPREWMHLTGYWRYTAPSPAAEAHEEEDDDAHERLHTMTDLAPGFAVRAAITLGLVDLVHSGVRDLPELARRSATDPETLGVLMSYLVSIEVFARDEDGGYRLTPISDELIEDDHSAEEYHLDGAHAALDLSLSGLVHTLRTGRSGYRTAAGQTLGVAVRTDETLGGSARSIVEETALWVVPGVVGAYDWEKVSSLTAAGSGTGSVVNALVKAFPTLKVRIAAMPSALGVLRESVLDTDVLPKVELVASASAVPPGGDGTYLLAHLLTWLPDGDAVQVLTETANGLPDGADLVMVEPCMPDDFHDAEDMLYHLRLKCAFGSGLRPAERIEGLAAQAGLRVRFSRNIGWDHRLWVLEAAR